MSWKWQDKRNERGALVAEWNVPIIGVDTQSGDTRLFDKHVAYTQNMRLSGGRPEGVNGYSLLDTTMDADDNAAPAGFAQYISGATEQYHIIQADGKAQRWDAAANAWVQLQTGLTVTDHWNAINYSGYLIWANLAGNWKWNGSNFLPLGARIITDCESDQNGQFTGETAEATTVREGTQSYLIESAAATSTLTFTPTTNLNLTTALLGAPAYSETNASIGFWFRVSNTTAIDSAASNFEIATSSGVTERQIALSAWIDKATNAAVVIAANTWYQIEIPLSSMTETGDFNLADVDTLIWRFDDSGTRYNAFIDGVYIIYNVSTGQMPGCATMAVWNDVLFGSGATATIPSTQDPSDIHFADVGSPDEYDSTAFISVNPDAGGGVRALKRFFNQVFVGKTNTIHSLGGTTAGTTYPNFNFEILDVTAEHGCDGHRSVVEMNKKLWFPWKGLYYSYDGTGTTEMGYRVSPDLADHAASLLTQKASALLANQQEIWLAYPGSGDTNNTRLVRMSESGGQAGFWGVEDSSVALNLNLLTAVIESGVEKLVGVDEAGDVMWLDDSAATDFDGTAIVRIVRFPWLAVSGAKLAYWGAALALFDAQTSGTVSLRYRIADHPRAFDAATFVEAATQALSSADTYGWVEISEIARWIQLEFRSSAAQFSVQLPLTIEAFPVGYQA
mgnify:FL=1